MRTICAAMGLAVTLLLSGCSERPTEEQAENLTGNARVYSASDVIPYEDFARAIDQGRTGEYIGKRLRIEGHVRAYLALDGKQILVIGEPLPTYKFPTMWCDVPPSDAEALEFRGSQSGVEGLYNSAFPDRVVVVDALFTGRVEREGAYVYEAEDCTLMK